MNQSSYYQKEITTVLKFGKQNKLKVASSSIPLAMKQKLLMLMVLMPTMEHRFKFGINGPRLIKLKSGAWRSLFSSSLIRDTCPRESLSVL